MPGKAVTRAWQQLRRQCPGDAASPSKSIRVVTVVLSMRGFRSLGFKSGIRVWDSSLGLLVGSLGLTALLSGFGLGNSVFS